MKTFLISHTPNDVYTLKVEAANDKEAIEKAKSIDWVNWEFVGRFDNFYQCEGEII